MIARTAVMIRSYNDFIRLNVRRKDDIVQVPKNALLPL